MKRIIRFPLCTFAAIRTLVSRHLFLTIPSASGEVRLKSWFLVYEYTFVRFDQYADGDPYSDPNYVHCFRMVLRAMHENRKTRIRFHGHTGARHSVVCNPYRLEYSEKDDKFRILVTGMRRMNTVNMARIRSCELLEEYDPASVNVPKEHLKELTLLLHDERNGLERVLLHFSHFEKETQKLDERLYRITLQYDQHDETELLIRVLSFGPVLEVVAPITFRQLMQNRIQKQISNTI